ncbi:ABC transporter substrate-binding protein [Vallitalea okinawensis]|uniref:ABC transporter substrate-binding protein n=1 Tax=Vallitalea okinawensis TaxID=2078660 RepID=UPI000CFAF8B2|nr:ABC transporter substrate-binding protein [Vallitalea okinawensis]
MKKIWISLLCIALLFTGCMKEEVKTVKIAEQYGLAYAPLQIMKEKGFLEEELPDAEIQWKKLGNTAAIREAMLANEVDLGFMGIPPFLIGLDNGMEWKIMSGLSSCPLGLVSNDPDIKSLEDIAFEDKIALPQPGSIQHILLSMAAEKQLGDASVFDEQLVTLKHPDGMVALEAGKEISAHFTSPPYLFMELDNPKHHLVVTGEEAVGHSFTFIVGVGTEEFYSRREHYEAFLKALDRSIDFMNNNKDEATSILAEVYNMEVQVLESYLNQEGMVYSNAVEGVEEFIDFMYRNEYLKENYGLEEVLWD